MLQSYFAFILTWLLQQQRVQSLSLRLVDLVCRENNLQHTRQT